MGVATVEGPAWCAPGLATRRGVYPLAVEQPVLNRVSLLVPGVTSLTTIARYYSFYWALADFAGSRELDASACRTLVRNAEVALAWASALNPDSGDLTGPGRMHGADAVTRLLQQGRANDLAKLGPGSYSERSWGFWSQYGGSSVVLKTAATESNAIRQGARACPAPVKQMFEHLLRLCAGRPPVAEDVPDFVVLTETNEASADIMPLRGLLTATVQGVHDPNHWLPSDVMRRSTMRILARSAQLSPNPKGWQFTLADGVAYGDRLDVDPVLVEERRQAEAWRGMLLRRHSVGAWRVFWSALVAEVLRAAEPVSRDELHEWVRGQVGTGSVADFADGLPPVQVDGHPAPAEEQVKAAYAGVEAWIGVLLLGAFRLEHVDGEVLSAFLGGSAHRRVYLDPHWVYGQYVEYRLRSLGDFACALVDDMLAQSHRVALRKMRVEGNGQMILPTKLHEREGRWFAESAEGSGNIGVRADQVGQICTQLGMFTESDGGPAVTTAGRELLGLPE
ncbi:hypothetical protein A5765_18820 [Mycolicibacterium celeriflavum]|nr:hypothetical protein A5765_18820 [Mycolicibacterium celeriflavum]